MSFNTGAFGEGFPYSNFHDLNMDWIIKIAKDFLDQYTNIQTTIQNGLENLDTKTTENLAQLDTKTIESLAQLNTKAAEITALLNQWYDTHSSDIANQLASALASLTTALNTAIASFNASAEEKAINTIASIPADYTTLANLTTAVQNMYDSICTYISGIELDDPDIWEVGHINDDGTNNTDNINWIMRTKGFIRGVNISIAPKNDRLDSEESLSCRVTIFKYNADKTFVSKDGPYNYQLPQTIDFSDTYYYRLILFYGNTQPISNISTFLTHYDITGNLVSTSLENSIDTLATILPCGYHLNNSEIWENGNIDDSTGENDNTVNWIIRTRKPFKAFNVNILANDGYKVKIFKYSSAMQFISHGSPVTSLDMNYESGYWYRIIAFKDNATPLTNISSALSHFDINGCIIEENQNNFFFRNLVEFNITSMVSSDGHTSCPDTYDLTGLDWNAVGDSITEGYYDEDDQLYVAKVASKTGLIAHNYGLGSCTIAVNDTYLHGQSIVERIENISDADIWTIQGGLNDQLYNSPIGNIYSTDTSTVYGALKSIVENIQKRENNPKILFITPLQSNRNSLYMQQLRQAMIDVADVYGINYVDLYAVGGFSTYNVMRLTHDGVHPTPYGTNMFYKQIIRAIESI